MQFYFIRHGQSKNNASWDSHGDNYPRVEDPELTEIGHRQARLVAQFLACSDVSNPDGEGQAQDSGNSHGPLHSATHPMNLSSPRNLGHFGITHLYTSLMIRSVQTGTAISEALGLPLVAWLDAHETGGIFLEDSQTGEKQGLPGHNRAYFERYFPHLVLPDSLGEQGWWNRPFEDYEQRPTRAKRFVQDLLARHGGSDDRVAVVSHGAFYNYMVWAILGLNRECGIWFAMNNTALTRIDFGEEVRIAYTNRADFLPAELIT
ncbi:MAG: histidine phosphatase family protein [Anaerolineae bacterium]|nr:histidine phosphatase family protein [Anaerolineae bacterium]